MDEDGYIGMNWPEICKECEHGPERSKCTTNRNVGCMFIDGYDFRFRKK